MEDNKERIMDTAKATDNKLEGGILKFIKSEFKPRGNQLTLFNIITAPIILLGVVLMAYRFAFGLGAATNLSQEFPWGIWIGFDVVTGVAFAAGAYTLTFMVYVVGMDKYHGIVRATVLNGFLAYVFYAGALALDVGRPWNMINPMIGNSFGFSSVLFLVAWHFLLYMIAQFVEFSPAVCEWLGLKRLRRITGYMTLGAVIFGICLSMLHQSGLGALFLMAKNKIHPLWYSEFIPVLFVVSSVYSGMSIIIIEGAISHRVFKDKITPKHHGEHTEIMVGLGRVATVVLFVYFFMKVIDLVHSHNTALLATPMGSWYLLELLGFVVLPFLLYAVGTRKRNNKILLTAAIVSALGIILNRLNISVIAFKWDSPMHYIPSWMEIEITLAIIFAEIWVFRWVVNRMPVLSESPAWAKQIERELAEGPQPVVAEGAAYRKTA
jgi:Ni/Fe-hydrogenase subunit HybB-like protein